MTSSVDGYRLKVSGDRDFARDGLAEDVRLFAGQAADGPSSAAGHVEVRVVHGTPGYGSLPISDDVISTPRNVVYRDNARRIIDDGGARTGHG